MTKLKFLVFVCLTSLLVSCGFHLRGQGPNAAPVNMSGLSIFLAVTDADKALYRQVKNELRYANLTVSDNPSLSSLHLIVLKSKLKKRAIGTDSIGRNNEFELKQTVEFLISQKSNKNLANEEDLLAVENQQIFASRNLYIDNNDLIGRSAEEKVLLNSIRKELSKKIMAHIIAVVKLNPALPNVEKFEN